MTQIQPPESSTTLRVLSWNIHKGVGGLDRRYSFDRTIAVIKEHNPDIVLLQEVAQGIKGLGHHDQVDLLTQALGLHAAFYLEHRFRVGGYGNLILSRWPLLNTSHLDLTIGKRKQRGMLLSQFRPHAEGSHPIVSVCNLHLGLSASERARQLDRVTSSQLVAELMPHEPTIVAGDLNDLWGNLGTRHLLPLGFKQASRLKDTFPSALPLRPLDGLFFRGGLSLVHFATSRTGLSRTASDHLPIFAVFVLGSD